MTKHTISLKIVLSITFAVSSPQLLSAQDLAPRAYIITPVHSNAVNLSYAFYNGSILFDGATPITDSSGRINVEIFSLTHSLNFFGRSANISVAFPYGAGHLQGKVLGMEERIYRSGLLDSSYRFAVNLKGGPAMTIQEMGKWRQKTIIGASLKVVAPTGQYDPSKVINYGANRWAFKPEIGVTQRWGHWQLDTYGAVWFFTTNHQFYTGTNTQSQSPIGAFEGHLSYDVKPRLWVSLDGNFWFGGRTTLNGVVNINTLQRNSRLGGTVSVPISKHQSLKFSYSDGTVIRYGGDFQAITVGWQYSWLGRPN